jgi:hypothetical protein
MGLLLIPSHAECWPAGHCLAGSFHRNRRQTVMIFGSVTRSSVVIAREGGQSSNHKTVRDYWMPRLRGA